MPEFSNTFKNKKVFLTGHTGFKGSWLTVWLKMMGADVKGYSLKPEKISLYNKIKSQIDVESVIADIRNTNRLKKEILSFEPDFVFHLAAQAIVRESYKIPVETFETNVIGTANVLDALRFLKKKCICVVVTTDKVYENLELNYAYKETDKLGGYDPYSASKASAEIITESFRLSFFNPDNFNQHKKAVATGRAGNVIGGGDYAIDRIVPDIFRALSSHKTIIVRNPKAVRPWQHVLEPLHGYLILAAKMNSDPKKYASSYNFGPEDGNTYAVEDLVNLAIKKWGEGNFKNEVKKNTHHEAGLLMLDISKAKKELSWKPGWNSPTTIAKTIDWYKKSLLKNTDILRLCEEDIMSYIKEKKTSS
jgi:CDP-glucose 4,6-dehydratase